MANLRRLAHCLVAAVLYYSGALHLRSWFLRHVLQRRHVAVIGLHRVLTSQEAARTFSETGMVMLLPTFERLLRALRKHYRVLSHREFKDIASGDTERPLCLITFDDGWRDTYENALPRLQEHRVCATLFVATGLLNQDKLFWVERLSHLWKQYPHERESLMNDLRSTVPATSIFDLADVIAVLKTVPAANRERSITSAESRFAILPDPDAVDRFMTWEQIKASARFLTIGSHTVTHPLLTHEKSSDVDHELRASKDEIELHLKEHVSTFAYPNGDYNSEIELAVIEAGYEFAFTTRTGVYRHGDDPLAVPRILLHEGNVTGLTGRFSNAMFHLRLTGWRLGWL